MCVCVCVCVFVCVCICVCVREREREGEGGERGRFYVAIVSPSAGVAHVLSVVAACVYMFYLSLEMSAIFFAVFLSFRHPFCPLRRLVGTSGKLTKTFYRHEADESYLQSLFVRLEHRRH